MRKTQELIINELGIRPTIDAAHEIHARSRYLAEYLGQSGMGGFVLGISGGQDSLLAGLLAARAVDLRRTDGHDAEFHAVLLPYGVQRDRDDALLAVDVIQPDYAHDLDIAPATDAFVHTFATREQHPLADFDKGNVKARMRMIVQYALAGTHSLLVVGTDHAAEAVTGFYTKYGDGGSDILPLAGLNKRQGRELLTRLEVPRIFVDKPPTADLLDATPRQADETELGLSYDIIDDYLEGKTVPADQAAQIERRFAMTAHKRMMPAAFERQ